MYFMKTFLILLLLFANPLKPYTKQKNYKKGIKLKVLNMTPFLLWTRGVDHRIKKKPYGRVEKGWLKRKWAPAYQTREYKGKLIIKPYSRLLLQVKGNYDNFLKSHTFTLTSKKNPNAKPGKLIRARGHVSYYNPKDREYPLNVYYKKGLLESCFTNYNDEILYNRYPKLKEKVKGRSYKYALQGWGKVAEDGIIIEPLEYLGGSVSRAVNQTYTLRIRNKETKKEVFKKELITLFEVKKRVYVLQVRLVTPSWEKNYGFYPDVYSSKDFAVRAYDQQYFFLPIGEEDIF